MVATSVAQISDVDNLVLPGDDAYAPGSGWFWGFYPTEDGGMTDLQGWQWTPEDDPAREPNFIAYPIEDFDTRQGVSYPTSAFFALAALLAGALLTLAPALIWAVA